MPHWHTQDVIRTCLKFLSTNFRYFVPGNLFEGRTLSRCVFFINFAWEASSQISRMASDWANEHAAKTTDYSFSQECWVTQQLGVFNCEEDRIAILVEHAFILITEIEGKIIEREFVHYFSGFTALHCRLTDNTPYLRGRLSANIICKISG